MVNLTVKAFENSLVELINGANLPISVKELIVDRVHSKLINAVEVELINEANELKKGEEDGKEETGR